jgi:hypothetical protein
VTGIKIPELIETWRIARAIGWSTRKTTKFFCDAGLAEHVIGHAEHMVVRSDFEATMPVVYRIFVREYESGRLVSNRGRWSRETKTSEDSQNATCESPSK